MLAWAAGLYEGEGPATRCGGYLRLALKMTNEEAVRRFAAVVPCATVYGPYNYDQPDGCVRKPHWIWIAQRDDALSVADELRPWLTAARRAQLERVLRAEA